MYFSPAAVAAVALYAGSVSAFQCYVCDHTTYRCLDDYVPYSLHKTTCRYIPGTPTGCSKYKYKLNILGIKSSSGMSRVLHYCITTIGPTVFKKFSCPGFTIS